MKRKTKRLHSDDARLLRDMVLSLVSQINELEQAMGELQEKRLAEMLDASPLAEVVEV